MGIRGTQKNSENKFKYHGKDNQFLDKYRFLSDRCSRSILFHSLGGGFPTGQSNGILTQARLGLSPSYQYRVNCPFWDSALRHGEEKFQEVLDHDSSQASGAEYLRIDIRYFMYYDIHILESDRRCNMGIPTWIYRILSVLRILFSGDSGTSDQHIPH